MINKKLIITLFFYAAMKDKFESCEAGQKIPIVQNKNDCCLSEFAKD